MKKLTLILMASTITFVSLAQSKAKKTVVATQQKSAEVIPAATPLQGAPAQPIANSNVPILKFKTEKHDFGTVPEGPAAVYDFEFTNEGKEPLILSKVQASCGCTTPTWPQEPILPGASAKITASFDTKGRPGTFDKTITVISNAKNPTSILSIYGTVEKAAPVTDEKKSSTIDLPTKK
jgi:hypothetical protein